MSLHRSIIDYFDYNHSITEEQYHRLKRIIDNQRLMTTGEVISDAVYCSVYLSVGYGLKRVNHYELLIRPGSIVKKLLSTEHGYLVRKCMRVV